MNIKKTVFLLTENVQIKRKSQLFSFLYTLDM